MIDKKPEELSKELEEYELVLSQSSYLVNMNHIEIIHVDDSDYIILFIWGKFSEENSIYFMRKKKLNRESAV